VSGEGGASRGEAKLSPWAVEGPLAPLASVIDVMAVSGLVPGAAFTRAERQGNERTDPTGRIASPGFGRPASPHGCPTP